MAQKYYNTSEAAEVLGVSLDRVNEMVLRRELYGYRDGADWKFKVEDVERVAADDRVATDRDPALTATLDGTEYEDTGIAKPFNPTLINILTKQMSLDTLIKRIELNEIDLSPDFQRNEVWNPTARARLIESLLIRIPLPAFYMDATDENHWLVVDGLQRLSTLRDFVLNRTMKLVNFEFLTDFHKRGFDDLPRNYQRRIEETQVTVYLIEKGTPPEVKFNIFKRINTGGLPLTSQEIRHALNQGPVTSYLKELANSEEFQQATRQGVSDQANGSPGMRAQISGFHPNAPQEYRASDFDAFLSDAMAALNKMTSREGTIGRKANQGTECIACDIRRCRIPEAHSQEPSKSPVNKALFEVWTVTLDNQSDESLHRLKASSTKVKHQVDSFMRNDSEFINAVSQGTGDIKKVQLRFEKFGKVIEEAVL